MIKEKLSPVARRRLVLKGGVRESCEGQSGSGIDKANLLTDLILNAIIE